MQARPADGRPLSAGSDAQIDLDLAAFVYELAGIVGALPNAVATLEWERMTARAEPAPSDTAIRNRFASARGAGSTVLPRLWRGEHPATSAQTTLRIEKQAGSDFGGTLEYDHGGVTEVVGRIKTDAQSLRDDPRWRSLGKASDVAVVFREVRVVRPGQRPLTIDGEYRAFIDRGRMAGGWFAGDTLIGTFAFAAEEEVAAT